MTPPTAPEAIARRRTTRRFDPDRPLADDLLRRILRLATFSPSRFNLQPWRFVVVRSARNRRRLRACADGLAAITEAPAVVIVLGTHHPHRTDLDAALGQALERGAISPPEAAEARARAPRAMESRADPSLWAMRPAAMAAATLAIAAESLGVASAPIEAFDPDRVRRAFGVPDDHTVGLIVALGYSAEPAPFPGRFALGHVCYEEHFGQPWTLGECESGAVDSDDPPL